MRPIHYRACLLHRFTTLIIIAVLAKESGFTENKAFSADKPSRPNIVFILADDMGYSDVGCYGSEIDTPNLDGLAQNGLRFTQFYNTGRCWPSRASLLSGYFPQQVNRDPARTRPKWAALLPQLLKPAGYHSYHSGKWHVDGPVLAAGFEHSYNTTDHDRNFGPKQHWIDDEKAPLPKPEDNYYSTTAIGQHAVDWLKLHDKEHAQQPFFLYVAFISPHFPLQAPATEIAKYRQRYQVGWDAIREARFEKQKKTGLLSGELSAREPKTVPNWNLSAADLQKRIGPGEVLFGVPWQELNSEQQQFQAEKMAIHAAMCDHIDRAVGQVLTQLKAMHALDNTLIMFASDNGASAEQIIRGDGHDPKLPSGAAGTFLGLGAGWSTTANTPFRKHKSWVHEGGVATPLIVHWPQGITAKNEFRRAPSHLVDIMPTFLELAGAKSPDTWQGETRPPLSGRSLVSDFQHEFTGERPPIWFYHVGNRALRVGDWKVVSVGNDGPWELYNLATDRTEMHDLAQQKPEKLAELTALWSKLERTYAAQGASGGPAEKPKSNARNE